MAGRVGSPVVQDNGSVGRGSAVAWWSRDRRGLGADREVSRLVDGTDADVAACPVRRGEGVVRGTPLVVAGRRAREAGVRPTHEAVGANTGGITETGPGRLNLPVTGNELEHSVEGGSTIREQSSRDRGGDVEEAVATGRHGAGGQAGRDRREGAPALLENPLYLGRREPGRGGNHERRGTRDVRCGHACPLLITKGVGDRSGGPRVRCREDHRTGCVGGSRAPGAVAVAVVAARRGDVDCVPKVRVAGALAAGPGRRDADDAGTVRRRVARRVCRVVAGGCDDHRTGRHCRRGGIGKVWGARSSVDAQEKVGAERHPAEGEVDDVGRVGIRSHAARRPEVARDVGGKPGRPADCIRDADEAARAGTEDAHREEVDARRHPNHTGAVVEGGDRAGHVAAMPGRGGRPAHVTRVGSVGVVVDEVPTADGRRKVGVRPDPGVDDRDDDPSAGGGRPGCSDVGAVSTALERPLIAVCVEVAGRVGERTGSGRDGCIDRGGRDLWPSSEPADERGAGLGGIWCDAELIAVGHDSLDPECRGRRGSHTRD